MREFSDYLRERILNQLENRGMLFRGFRLTHDEGGLTLIGEGSFSYIYEATADSDETNVYALKVDGFGDEVMDPKRFWENFRVQHILSVECPQIIRVISARELDVGINEAGDVTAVRDLSEKDALVQAKGLRIQLVLMEKAEPVLVKDRYGVVSLAKKELETETEVMKFAYQIGNAIRYAHLNHVLHRDIKLENTFWDESAGMYKLGDFGAARVADDGKADTIVYSDGYGAPEIERLSDNGYDARADIYSLGITLYLLLNDMKFPGSDGYHYNPVQYDRDYVFPAPLHASARMTDIIRKMTSFDADHRYQTMGDFLNALTELDGQQADETEATYTDEIEETELYSEPDENNGSDEMSRAARLIKERKDKEQKAKEIRTGTAVLALIVFLLLRLLQHDYTICRKWEFLIFPMMIAIEMVFEAVGENTLLCGLAAAAAGVWSVFKCGFSPVYLIFFIGIALRDRSFKIAELIGFVLWMLVVFWRGLG